MAAGAWTFTNTARDKILKGQFDFDTDTFKCALYLSTSNLTVASTTYAGVTNEHGTSGTGYTTGGIAVTFTFAGTTTVTVDFASPPVWTAGASGITARWAAIYEVSGDIVCFCLLDSTPADVTATSGNTLTIDPPPAASSSSPKGGFPLAVTVFDTNTLSTTGGSTEDFLCSVDEAGTYTLDVDLNDMASNDVLEVRVYKMVRAGGTARVAYFTRREGVQPPIDLVLISVPISTPLTDATALRFSVTQTSGSAGVSLPWTVSKYA